MQHLAGICIPEAEMSVLTRRRDKPSISTQAGRNRRAVVQWSRPLFSSLRVPDQDDAVLGCRNNPAAIGTELRRRKAFLVSDGWRNWLRRRRAPNARDRLPVSRDHGPSG